MTQIDENGLRLGAEPAVGGVPKILTLGDSSVYGHGVRDGDTLHDQLKRELEIRGGGTVDVVCGGIPGYSVLQSLKLMEEVGWSLEPDVLVVASQFSDQTRDMFRDSEVLRRLDSPVVRVDRALSASSLYTGMRRAIARAKGVPEFAAIGWPVPGDTGVPRVSMREYVDGLEELLLQARSRGVGVVFLQLAQQDSYKRGAVLEYATTLAEVGEAWGVPVIRADVQYHLAGNAADELFLDEVHPSSLGHKLLAQGIAEKLLATGFPQELPVPLEEPLHEVEVQEADLPPSNLQSQQLIFLNR